MKTAKLILGGMWGGCWGFAAMQFARQGDWGMFALTLGLIPVVFYLVIWMIDIHFGD